MEINAVGLSGGKDSTATLLWMLNESGYKKSSIKAFFCDVGNEHDLTYQHIEKINTELHPVETIYPKETFFEQAKRKGRFPATKARFCTVELKIWPIRDYFKILLDKGNNIISHVGTRREEKGVGGSREKILEWDIDLTMGTKIRRPLFDWKIQDIIDIHNRYNFPMNPLYGYGCKRVGCFPCIMSSKPELYALQYYFPERIDEISNWEKELNSTFFPRTKVPEHFRDIDWVHKRTGQIWRVPSIQSVIEWSKTVPYRTKQYKFPLPPESQYACILEGGCE